MKHPEAKRGFVLLPRRWVVERTFGWLGRFRRLVRDYERLTETLAGRTIIAHANRDDGAERTAELRGNRLDVDEGKRMVVVGVLRVIDHGPAVVGRVFVPGWTELRVEE